jgi:hypothetical protein
MQEYGSFVVKNKTKRLQQCMMMRGVYASDDIAVLTFAKKSYTTGIFSETIIRHCPSRTIKQ